MASPEVDALLRQSRYLVGKAFKLTTELNMTVDELESFQQRQERRARRQAPYTGEERRRG